MGAKAIFDHPETRRPKHRREGHRHRAAGALRGEVEKRVSQRVGAGWGLAGFCPGPGIVAMASGEAKAALFVAAMVAGMVPTALSLSGDGAWRAPMGTVVIGVAVPRGVPPTVPAVVMPLLVPAGCCGSSSPSPSASSGKG